VVHEVRFTHQPWLASVCLQTSYRVSGRHFCIRCHNYMWANTSGWKVQVLDRRRRECTSCARGFERKADCQNVMQTIVGCCVESLWCVQKQ
jgi:hypothetical protein